MNREIRKIAWKYTYDNKSDDIIRKILTFAITRIKRILRNIFNKACKKSMWKKIYYTNKKYHPFYFILLVKTDTEQENNWNLWYLLDRYIQHHENINIFSEKKNNRIVFESNWFWYSNGKISKQDDIKPQLLKPFLLEHKQMKNINENFINLIVVR